MDLESVFYFISRGFPFNCCDLTPTNGLASNLSSKMYNMGGRRMMHVYWYGMELGG